MKKLNLPEDIKKYITKRRVKTLICFLITEIVFFVIAYLIIDRLEKWDMNNFIFTLAVIAAIPLFIFKIPNMILDKSYEGKIIKIDYKEENSNGGMRKSIFKSYRTIILVKTKKDKLYNVKLESLNTTGGPNGQIYKEGDTVLHVAGTDFPKIVRRQNMEFTTCVVCGSKNNLDSNTCGYCNHSLVIKS